MSELIPQPHGGALKPFEPGTSGNPAGKPKGARHLSSVIQELMDDDDFELKLKNGQILKGRPSRKLTEVMYGMAVSGNVKAAEWLAKHGYGTKQIVEFEGNPIEKILDKYGLNGESIPNSSTENNIQNQEKGEKSDKNAEKVEKSPENEEKLDEENNT